jgi:hypothetical protein
VLAHRPHQQFRFNAVKEGLNIKIKDPLHPAREPLAMHEQTRKTIGEYNFAGQYRPAPSPLGGGLVKAGWFRHYGAKDVPQFERVVQSWEPQARPRSSAITAFAQAGGYRAGTSI